MRSRDRKELIDIKQNGIPDLAQKEDEQEELALEGEMEHWNSWMLERRTHEKQRINTEERRFIKR